MAKRETWVFHISRWRYAWGYVLFILLAIGGISLYDHGYDILGYTLGVFALILILLLEVMVREYRVTIRPSFVEARLGILSRKVVKVQYDDITDLGVHQSFLQRILRYGNVDVATSATSEVEMRLHYFSSPNKIARLISERMEFARVHPAQHQNYPARPVQQPSIDTGRRV